MIDTNKIVVFNKLELEEDDVILVTKMVNLLDHYVSLYLKRVDLLSTLMAAEKGCPF